MCSTPSLDISLQCTDLCPPLCLIPLPQPPSPFAVHSENTIINTWLRTQEGSQEASLYEKRMFWVVHVTGSVDTVEIFENFCSRPMSCNACVSEVDAHHLWTLLFSSQGSGNLLWVFFCFEFVWGFVLLLLCFVFFCDFFSSPPSVPLGPSHASSHSLCTDWNFTYKLLSMICGECTEPDHINKHFNFPWVPVLLTMALFRDHGAFWSCFRDEGHLLWRIIACITEAILSHTKSFIFTQRRRKWLKRWPSS